MLRMFLGLACAAATSAISGCGAGGNPLPPDAGSPGYAQQSTEKMKSMYGVPKPSSGRALSASDQMKAMYGPARSGGAR